jgi:hypothetical protein
MKLSIAATSAAVVIAATMAASASAYSYPNGVRAAIVKGCIGNDYSSNNISYCNCFVNQAEKRYTVTQVIAIVVSDKTPARIMKDSRVIALAVRCIK